MIRVVLDTNVLASGFIGFGQPTSTPALLVRLWRSGSFQILASEHILAELDRTLRSSYFSQRLSVRQVELAIDLVRRESILISDVQAVSGIASHQEDDLILDLASAGDAAYLVTGDRQLQALGTYQGTSILSPRAFLELLLAPDSETIPDETG